MSEYTKEDVDKAKDAYEEALRGYLLARGWVEFDTEYSLWSKDGSGCLTNEEAYWQESKEKGGE
jgi:hypothetical protein